MATLNAYSTVDGTTAFTIASHAATPNESVNGISADASLISVAPSHVNMFWTDQATKSTPHQNTTRQNVRFVCARCVRSATA